LGVEEIEKIMPGGAKPILHSRVEEEKPMEKRLKSISKFLIGQE
jgi:hypothetical protein